MKTIIIYIFFIAGGFLYAQNSARIFSADGAVFKVFSEGQLINKNMEANVLIEHITKDTLMVKIEFENSATTNAVIYLLDKGEKTIDKEYNYKIVSEKENAKLVFTGIKDAVHLPDPLVPGKPATKNN